MAYSGTPEERKAKQAAAMRNWRAANKDKVNEAGRLRMQRVRRDSEYWREYYRNYARKWRAENPEKHRTSRQKYDTPERWRKYHLHRYRLTPEQFDAMLVAQGGVCAICGDLPSGNNGNAKRLHVDHDHATGKVRGVLCTSCNLALASFDRVADFGYKVAAYLALTR